MTTGTKLTVGHGAIVHALPGGPARGETQAQDLRKGAAETARVPPVARLLFPTPRCSRRRRRRRLPMGPHEAQARTGLGMYSSL